MFTTNNTLLLVIDFQERMMPSIRNHEELARKAAIFIKGCHMLGVPTLVTQQYTRGLGETIAELKVALNDFEPIEKISFSCFGCEEFVEKLNKSDRKNILVTGVEAHICVQQTVADLLTNNYNVYVIADCIGSRSEVDFNYSVLRMQSEGAIFTTAESALFEMMVHADHPKRKNISNLVK